VTFLGYTNGSNGIRLATFAITNLSQIAARREQIYDTSARTPDGFEIPKAFTYYDQTKSPPTLLNKRDYEFITIQHFSNNVSWRANFFFTPMSLRRRYAEWCYHHKLHALESITPGGNEQITMKIFSSEWINR
ncbi:MAG TPA: hypothetical protein VGC95_04655, partial [Chitinophagaceae bacterium]